MGSGRGLIRAVVFQNGVADGDAFIADVSAGVIAGGGDELADYVLTFMTKRASQRVIGSGTFHAVFPSTAGGGEMGEGLTPRAFGVGNLTGHIHYPLKVLLWQRAVN